MMCNTSDYMDGQSPKHVAMETDKGTGTYLLSSSDSENLDRHALTPQEKPPLTQSTLPTASQNLEEKGGLGAGVVGGASFCLQATFFVEATGES